MGATEFLIVSNGASPQEAFGRAVEEAQYESGHGGYTGTIAEKHSFKMITVPQREDPVQFAEEILYEDDGHWVQNKWGLAACVKLTDTKYLFFGVASS
jgi:hypothetical protein